MWSSSTVPVDDEPGSPAELRGQFDREQGEHSSASSSAPSGDSGPCLSEEEVLAFSEGSLMPAGFESVHAHLDWCPICQELVNAAVHQWDHPPASVASDRIWMATFGAGQMIASRYRIEKFLGRGGMGEVYAAFDSVLRERIALKTVLSTTSDNPHAVRRLFTEARLARRVSHPNVCRVHDVGVHEEPGRVDEPLHFLTMELIEGKRLGQLIRGGPIAIDTVIAVARQILCGLRAAHESGVLHRDLKSDNVMVSGQAPDLRIAITDFGLSRALNGELRALGTIGQERVGSLAYMAPEQILGHELGPETDIFGFGVVLFEMLAGKLPFSFEHATAANRVRQRLSQRALPPSQSREGLPRWLDEVVLRCLQSKPADRYQDAASALTALDRALS